MSLRTLSCLALVLLLAHCSSFHLAPAHLPPGPSPLAWNGTYHFNPSDTDFMSSMKIHFRPGHGPYSTPWVAEGTITCHFWKNTISFKRAQVEMTAEGPEISCTYFTITPYKDRQTGEKSFYIDRYQHHKETPSR